ncbi:hypothetical protein [Bacteroides sp.]
MTKVIHVHLIFEKKDYYFGSISAIFDVLNEQVVGIKKSTLFHSGLSDGNSLPTSRAIIKQSHLIRSKRQDTSEV